MNNLTKGYLQAVATLLRECPNSREQAVVLLKHVKPISEREWYSELDGYDRVSLEGAGLAHLIRAKLKELT